MPHFKIPEIASAGKSSYFFKNIISYNCRKWCFVKKLLLEIMTFVSFAWAKQKRENSEFILRK